MSIVNYPFFTDEDRRKISESLESKGISFKTEYSESTGVPGDESGIIIVTNVPPSNTQ